MQLFVCIGAGNPALLIGDRTYQKFHDRPNRREDAWQELCTCSETLKIIDLRLGQHANMPHDLPHGFSGDLAGLASSKQSTT